MLHVHASAQGTDGTPYVAVDMYYHPETKLMEVSCLCCVAMLASGRCTSAACQVINRDE